MLACACVGEQAGSEAARQKRVSEARAYAEAERVGTDGLPHVGAVLYPGQAYYSVLDTRSGLSCPKYLVADASCYNSVCDRHTPPLDARNTLWLTQFITVSVRHTAGLNISLALRMSVNKL